MPNDLIEGLLPIHEVSILAGASGAGKTTVIMTMLKMIQDGKPVFGMKAQPGMKLGYIAADRTWAAYQKLADALHLDLSKIRVRALIDDDTIDTTRFEQDPQAIMYSLLQQMANDHIDLVVVDPLVVFLGCDTIKYHVNAARLIRLNKFCRVNDLTVLGTHHATKARTDYSFKRAQDRISGTSALLGFTSTQLFLAAPEETGSEFTEWHIVSHHAAARVINLKRSETTGLFEMADPLVDVPAAHREVDVQILSALPKDGTPIDFHTLAAVLGQPVNKVHGHIKQLEQSGFVVTYPGGFCGQARGCNV